MNTKDCDIILRDCGKVGWLGILKDPLGREIYRTGNHQPTAGEALAKVKAWIGEQP